MDASQIINEASANHRAQYAISMGRRRRRSATGIAGVVSGFSHIFESNVDQLALPAANGTQSNFSTWKDQVTGANVVPASSGFAKRTYNGALEFQNDATQLAQLNGIKLTDSTDFGVVARFYRLIDPTWAFLNFGTDGDDNVRLFLTAQSGFVGFDMYDGTLNPTGNDFFSVGVASHVLFIERAGTNIRFQVDDHAPVTLSSAVNLTTNHTLEIGNVTLGGGSPYATGTGGVTDVAWRKNQAFTAAERTALLDYFTDRYAPWRVAGNVGLWEVRDRVVTSGSNVVSWSDSPGRTSHDFGLSESYTAPVFTANAGDGAPSIDFAGGADPSTTGNLLTLSGFSTFLDLDNPFTFAGVLYLPDDAFNAGGLLGFGDYPTPGRYTWFQSASLSNFAQLVNNGGSSLENTTSQTPLAGWHFVYGRRLTNGSGFTQAFDGLAEQSAANPTGSIAADILHLGGVIQTPGAYIAQCKWRALAAFNRDIELAQVAELRTYWKTLYPGLP